MELILILLIVVLLFGAKRIPEIMGGLGKGTRGFRKSLEGADTEVTAVVDIRKERIEPK